MSANRLTEEEKDFIYKNREKMTVEEIAKELNRKYHSISDYMRRNKIPKLSRCENLNPYSLTDREIEVLNLMAKGYSNADIAKKLFIEITTVVTHTHHIYNKLNISEYNNHENSVLRVRAVLKYQQLVKEGKIDAKT